jgi:diamine N-acetyltransferase
MQEEKMISIEFRPISKENWRDCIRLKVKDEQKALVAPNDYSLLQAYYEPENRSHPYGIYADEKMVGFIMTSEPEDIAMREAIYIHRFMIGSEFQGEGYGHAALLAFIERVKQESRHKRIYLSYDPANTVGAKLYANVGFKELGVSEDWGNEMGAELVLDASA